MSCINVENQNFHTNLVKPQKEPYAQWVQNLLNTSNNHRPY